MSTGTKSPGWRVGDAGHTVFGPNLGKPSPETIATRIANPAHASLIVRAVNSFDARDAALRDMIAMFEESHETEMQTKHHGDSPKQGPDPKRCSYCRSIKAAVDALKAGDRS